MIQYKEMNIDPIFYLGVNTDSNIQEKSVINFLFF